MTDLLSFTGYERKTFPVLVCTAQASAIGATQAPHWSRICRDTRERLPYGMSWRCTAEEGNLCRVCGMRQVVH